MERYVETERVYRDTRALLSISIQICPVYDNISYQSFRERSSTSYNKKGREGAGYRDTK